MAKPESTSDATSGMSRSPIEPGYPHSMGLRFSMMASDQRCLWVTVAVTDSHAFLAGYSTARSFALEARPMRHIDEDQAERSHEQALRAVDPRVHQPKQRARLALLEDDRSSLFERGTELEGFIDPEDFPATQTRRRR